MEPPVQLGELYSVKTQVRRESKQEGVCVCIKLMHFAARQKLTQPGNTTLLQWEKKTHLFLTLSAFIKQNKLKRI